MTYRELLNDVKNLDDEVDLALFNKDKNNEKKAYIYLTGFKDKKVYIDGDTCYEVSERVPGIFSFKEAQEIVKWFDSLYYNSGWRIPTKEELDLIYINLKCSGQIHDDCWFWSSTKDGRFGCNQRFLDGSHDTDEESFRCSIYAIRSFKEGE